MIAKKDIQEMFRQSDARWDKRFNESDARWDKRFNESDARWDKRFANLRKELKDDIETAVAQVIEFVMKYAASKEDLKQFATKEDLKEFKEEVKSEFRDVRRQINDLKADTPTPQEFTDHEKRIAKLETVVFPA